MTHRVRLPPALVNAAARAVVAAFMDSKVITEPARVSRRSYRTRVWLVGIGSIQAAVVGCSAEPASTTAPLSTEVASSPSVTPVAPSSPVTTEPSAPAESLPSGSPAATSAGMAVTSDVASPTPDSSSHEADATAVGVGSTAGDTAEAAEATADSSPKAPLAVTDLKVEANPRMSLSCYVSWRTAEPADSKVLFGIEGHQFEVHDAALVTEHRVHVIGMHAETAYALRAVSSTASATGNADGEFTTGELPAGLPPKPTLLASDTTKMQTGWTLTNLYVGGSNFSTSPAIIVILDAEGQPVWYFVHGTTADQFGMTSTEWLADEGHVLVGNASSEPAREVDLEGNVLWQGPTGGTPPLSHHTSKLASGNYLVVRESNDSARVEELSADNDVVWTWDLYDHVQPTTTSADWCHLNSVSTDPDANFIYFNCRFQGLFKVDRATKEIVWQLGAAIDDSQSGDITYLPDNSARFNDAHDPDVYPDGAAVFYDNQGWSSHTGGEGNGSYHSRVVEYQLDEATKQATLSFEFPGNFEVDTWYKESWETAIWGDADRLENRNILITAGTRGAGTHTRIFEVTRDGEVVWGVEWPENNGSYRADRLPALALPLE